MTPPLEPRVIFEDAHLLVLSKPAGLLSQGGESPGENLVDWLRSHLGRPYVGLIHRLDRNTSGIMVVGKRTKAARRLSEALVSGELVRIYLAWIHGPLEGPARWRHRLEKDEHANLVRVLPAGRPGGKEARLSVVAERSGSWKGAPLTLARFELETGRSHQIRVQAAAEGHPLLGDAKYGRPDGFPRPALHSWRLAFPHPMSGEPMSFEDPLPPDLDLGGQLRTDGGETP